MGIYRERTREPAHLIAAVASPIHLHSEDLTETPNGILPAVTTMSSNKGYAAYVPW